MFLSFYVGYVLWYLATRTRSRGEHVQSTLPDPTRHCGGPSRPAQLNEMGSKKQKYSSKFFSTWYKTFHFLTASHISEQTAFCKRSTLAKSTVGNILSYKTVSCLESWREQKAEAVGHHHFHTHLLQYINQLSRPVSLKPHKYIESSRGKQRKETHDKLP